MSVTGAREGVPSPPSFLNLDLEIDAAFDLADLAAHFAGKAFILFQGQTETEFHLTLEPLIDGALSADPAACTEHLLSAIEALPDAVRGLWHACDFRVFDYGFEGGYEAPPICMDLPAPVLARAAKAGLSIRFTLYPFQAQRYAEDGAADE